MRYCLKLRNAGLFLLAGNVKRDLITENTKDVENTKVSMVMNRRDEKFLKGLGVGDQKP